MMGNLIEELKGKIITTFRLEHLTPAQIDAAAPLFGGGLGLDSIDALELAVMLERDYGIKLTDITLGRQVFQSVQTLADFITQQRNAHA
jgi:acyl carrier protein